MWLIRVYIISVFAPSLIFCEVLPRDTKFSYSNNDVNNKRFDKIETSLISADRNVRSSGNHYHQQQQRRTNDSANDFKEMINAENISDFQNQPRKPIQNLHPLVKKVSSASLSLIYLLLAWRAMGSYDSSVQFSNDFIKVISSFSVASIFAMNILGFIISVTKPNKFKVHLKFILALNTVREVTELLYNILKIGLTTSTSEFTKDFYFGRIIASVYFLLLCFSTSKIRWIDQKHFNNAIPPPQG